MKKTKLEENIDATPEVVEESTPESEVIDAAPEVVEESTPESEVIDSAPEVVEEESEEASETYYVLTNLESVTDLSEESSENKAEIEDDQVQISCFKCKANMTFGTDHRPQKHTCSCGAKYRVVYRKGQLSALLQK